MNPDPSLHYTLLHLFQDVFTLLKGKPNPRTQFHWRNDRMFATSSSASVFTSEASFQPTVNSLGSSSVIIRSATLRLDCYPDSARIPGLCQRTPALLRSLQ